jgi:hypothetical protein
MSKKIKLSYEGKEYTLEYTRNTALALEQSGFVLSDVRNKPVSSLVTLFNGAFVANHRRLEGSVVEKIFDSLKDKEKLLAALVGMYDETVSSLMDSSDDEGNATWEMTQ